MKKNRKLLVVEDDPGLRDQLKWCFNDFDVILVAERESALVELRRHEPAVVTLDLGLPPDPSNASEGLRALEDILQLAPHTKVIVVTGNDDRENALLSVRHGAYDFYHKPIDPEILSIIVERAAHMYDLEIENELLSRKKVNAALDDIITVSPKMIKMCSTVERVAPSDVTVLILGESGTGKELVARALHAKSGRSTERFVAINCAAIPENLLESELFGYEKGAFTGAIKQTIGKIEHAHGGTLFLDEIGDLPISLQAKLLRFLQERVIERLGARGEIPVDVRVVCATHQDIDKLMVERNFREDLYYRISEIIIKIPPLRERNGDASVLAQSFFHRFNDAHRRGLKGLCSSVFIAVESYEWPGNVRELENRIKRAVIMAEGSQITAGDLELSVDEGHVRFLNLRQVRVQAERHALLQAIALVNGNMSRAAEMLGITRPTLYSLLDKYEMRQ